MVGVLSSVSDLTKIIVSLGLVPSLFKPIPPIVDGLAPTASGFGKPLGLELLQQPASASASACAIVPYQPSPPNAVTFAPFEQAKANLYRYRQQQSVNLGSWFVLEQWMAPSVFTCANGNKSAEIDVASGWGGVENARMILEKHWDTFITEADFAYLSSIGINTVRIPIGYWSLGPVFCQGTPFEPYSTAYLNAWSRVVRAINFAAKYNIGVIVDLHGAPGSQNGLPHSGISDGSLGFFNNAAYIEKTVAVLVFLTQQLAPVTNVVGIQLLNEPVGLSMLEGFYDKTIAILRQVDPRATSFPFYIHDAFNMTRFTDWVGARSDFVVTDHHSYFVTSSASSATAADDAEAASGHTNDIRGSVGDALQVASKAARRNLIVGEFSCALTNASLSQEADPIGARRDFCRSQMDTYSNATSGWTFWTYVKEDCDPGWCFKSAVGNALPQTFGSYPNTSPIRSSGDAPASRASSVKSAISSISSVQPPDISDSLSTVSGDLSQPLAAPGTGTDTPDLGRRSTFRLLSGRYRGRHHRYSRVHSRSFNTSLVKKSLTPAQQAASKGYSDGFQTAKTFAEFDLSRLGFSGQYVDDSVRALQAADELSLTQEPIYRVWFDRGLKDGEAEISKAATLAG